MTRLSLFTVMAVAVLGLASAPGATVSFDDQTGTGYASAGHIQSIFAWTNPQLRQRARDITFSYNVTFVTYVQCNTGTPEVLAGILESRSDTVVHSKVRNNGFVFTGYGAQTSTFVIGPIGGPSTVVEELPLVSYGDRCPWGPGVVDRLDGDFWFGLFANYEGDEAPVL